jgi:hypothetical protein
MERSQAMGCGPVLGGRRFLGSLSFTSYQWIELVNLSLNDAAREGLVKAANEKWFSG